MDPQIFRAHYDGERIVLDEPVALEPGTSLLVTVLPDHGGPDTERELWLAASQHWLARAYGDDEPDYSDRIGKPAPAE